MKTYNPRIIHTDQRPQFWQMVQDAMPKKRIAVRRIGVDSMSSPNACALLASPDPTGLVLNTDEELKVWLRIRNQPYTTVCGHGILPGEKFVVDMTLAEFAENWELDK